MACPRLINRLPYRDQRRVKSAPGILDGLPTPHQPPAWLTLKPLARFQLTHHGILIADNVEDGREVLVGGVDGKHERRRDDAESGEVRAAPVGELRLRTTLSVRRAAKAANLQHARTASAAQRLSEGAARVGSGAARFGSG